MKNRTANAKRLEQSFAEAVGQSVDVQAMFNKAMEAVGYLIDNVARRIEWHEAEHRRLARAALAKGERPPARVSLMGELETIGRIIGTLQSPRLDEFRKGDPNAGAREICRILELARKDYGNGKEGSNKEEVGKDRLSPEAGEGGEGEADNPSQIPTPERAIPTPTDFHRRNSVRVERH